MNPFMARGWSPFPFQEETWNAYLAGRSGLLNAPTGSGKTLAVWLGPLLEAQAEAKRAELEAEARAKLENELGVVQQEGESLEDAARRRMNEAVDEQAQKALQKLLGGGN